MTIADCTVEVRMALFKLLVSILLFSLVYSAPVEVLTGTTSKSNDPVVTISDIYEDVKPSIKSDVLISTRETPTLSPTERSDLIVENNEGESLMPSVFVPTGVVNEEQTISSSSEPSLVGDLDPTSEPSIVSQTPSNVKEQHAHSDNTNEQGSNLEADPPKTDVKQQDDVGEVGKEPTAPSTEAQQPEDPFMNDRIPIPDPNPFDKDTLSIPEEPDVPPQITDRDPPQGPYEERPLDQTSEPFNEEEANEGFRIYPQPPFGAETTNQEKVIDPSSELSPEDDTAQPIAPESVQEDFTEIQSEPQDTDRINSDNVPIGSELPQDEGKEPIGIVQPEDVGPPFETYDDSAVENEDDTRLPTPDQSDRLDEEEDIDPNPPFPINMDRSEEMVGDPVEPPIREEAKPPAILVRDDLVSPVVTVIQIEQKVPPYLSRENIPLGDDSAGGETPEEEVSNPDNTEPEILSFDNRPEESGPMNIL